MPLRYLQYRRLITYARRSDGMLYAAVTFAGADRAIRLHTRRGRMDLWYREHRDGIIGVTITILISFITALITVLVVEQNFAVLSQASATVAHLHRTYVARDLSPITHRGRNIYFLYLHIR